MINEHTYTDPLPPALEPDDQAWDVFLPDGDDPIPEENDFWGRPEDDWDSNS